jgi:hypothetical protein
MRASLIIAVLAGLTWFFVVQKQQEPKKTVSNSKAVPEATASARPVNSHNWMKSALDRTNEVKNQVAQQRKADGTR